MKCLPPLFNQAMVAANSNKAHEKARFLQL